MIRQFDIVDNPSPRSRVIAPFVVVVQSHLYDEGLTVLVAPLLRMPREATVTRVSVRVETDSGHFLMMVSEIGAVERRLLGPARGSLGVYEDDIRRALDRLFTGF